MSFGKRSAGDPRPAPQPQQVAPETDGILSVRTRVANHGGLDKSFIALAAGVVILSAGAAIAAPSVFTLFDSGKPRTIAELIKGLDREDIKSVLATEAFPDAEGRAFLTSLEQHFPESHQRLLGQMASTAGAGGNRDDLVLDLANWGMQFGPANLEYLGRTGAEGFDGLLAIVTDSLDVIRKETGDCSLASFKRLAENENALQDLTRYGTDAYRVTMQTNRAFVELAARGRKAPKPVAELTADDEGALQSVFFSIITDPQMMQIAQQAMRHSGNSPEGMQQALESNVDLCQIGRSIIIKLERLPSGTKSRLLAVALSDDFSIMQRSMMDLGGLGGAPSLGQPMFGPPPGMPPEVIRRLEQLQ